MADEFDQYARKPQGASAQADDFEQYARPSTTSKPQDKPGFLSTVGGDLAQYPGKIWNTITHPFDSSELGQAANFSNSISPEDRATANRNASIRAGSFAGPLTPIEAREQSTGGRAGHPPLRTDPMGYREMAGHAVAPYIADAALGAIGEGIESPSVRSFVSGAAKATPRTIRNVIPYGAGAALMNRFMPGPIAHIADAAAAITAIPPIVRAGRAAAAGKDALGPIGNAILPIPAPRKMIAAPADTSFVRGRNALFGEQPAIGAAPLVRVTPPPPDGSFVRGAPAMTQPPNPARALPAAPRTLVTPAPIDASYVRGIDAQYPEVISGPLTNPETALLAPAKSAPREITPDYSGITSQYRPSRTKARFDASGKRIGG